MANLKFQKKKLATFFILFILLFVSCTSVPLEELHYPEGMEFEVPFNPEKNIVLDNGDTFIFFRLYNPKYDKALCLESIFKAMINLVEVNGIVASHCSIGFSLEDAFLSVTSSEEEGTEKNFCVESCTNIDSNVYMSKCDPAESLQTTYSLKVTQNEFDKAIDLTYTLLNDPRTEYSIGLNYKIAPWELKRKFFTSKEKRNIKTMKVVERPLINEKDERDFNCSSIIAYILINSVEKVRSFFEERGLDYNKITPSDIAEIPGVQKLFTSTWDNYDIEAKKYIAENWGEKVFYSEIIDESIDYNKEETDKLQIGTFQLN